MSGYALHLCSNSMRVLLQVRADMGMLTQSVVLASLFAWMEGLFFLGEHLPLYDCASPAFGSLLPVRLI